MKPCNVMFQTKILADTPIFQAARRSDIAMQVRTKMIKKGLKNIDLAERLGVSEANISRWLRGNQNLKLDTLYQIADALDEPLYIALGDVVSALGGGVQSSDCEFQHRVDSVHVNLTLPSSEYLADGPSPPEGNVVSMHAYKTLRLRAQEGSDTKFAAAQSSFGILEFEERMVN